MIKCIYIFIILLPSPSYYTLFSLSAGWLLWLRGCSGRPRLWPGTWAHNVAGFASCPDPWAAPVAPILARARAGAKEWLGVSVLWRGTSCEGLSNGKIKEGTKKARLATESWALSSLARWLVEWNKIKCVAQVANASNNQKDSRCVSCSSLWKM